MKRFYRVLMILALTLPVPALPNTAVDVARFGGIPDDGKPDTKAITAAIKAANSGDTVTLDKGVYFVDSTLKGKDGITLSGTSMDQTILRQKGNSVWQQSLLLLDGVKGMTVQDLTLDGDKQQGLPFGILGAYDGGGNRLLRLRITNLAAKDPDGTGPVGMLFSDQPDTTIQSCVFDDIRGKNGSGAGIGLYGGPYTVDSNQIRRVGRNGLYALRCSGSITNNVVEESGTGDQAGDTGISIELHPGEGEGGCKNVVVERNRVDSWISVVGAANAAIRHNRIGHQRADQRYSGIETSGENIVVSDNMVGKGVDTGVVIERPSFNIAVLDNEINGTDNVGLAFIGARQDDPRGWLVENVLVAGNRIAGADAGEPNAVTSTEPGSGLEINRNAVRVSIVDNEFLNNDASAIALFDEKGDTGPDQLFFVNNTFAGNKKGALSVYGHSQLRGRRVLWQGNEGAPIIPPEGTKPLGWTDFSPKITSSPAHISVNKVTRFSIESLPGAKVSDVLWDFGEGRPVSGETTLRKFAKPGTYHVRAVIWLKSGQAKLVSSTINVDQ